MDCCNYGQYGAGAWEGYAPQPYAPYAHSYYAPHAHDPYARYYRLDYPTHHMHHAEPHIPMDYGVYAAKEVRARRALARREQRALPAHLPLPLTPPLELGMNGRGPAYGEPQLWPHYQMGILNGGWGGSNPGGGWPSRASCSRDHMRYTQDCRQIKGPHQPVQNPMCQQDGKSTPHPMYEDTSPSYNGNENPPRREGSHPFHSVTPQSETVRPPRERFYPEPKRTPPEEKRPPVVPLPAFQQAFGSTEIGKFSEAFTRTEVAQEDATAENFLYESFTEWDGPTEPQWSTQPATREIKCEDNY